jgi:hypothetical protein
MPISMRYMTVSSDFHPADTGAQILVPGTFHVHDQATANWVVRKIAEARQYAERVEEWAEAELRRAKPEEEFLMFRFGTKLERWARAQIAVTQPRPNSVALPAGTIGFRLQLLWLGIVDEPKLLAWCKRNAPTAVVTSERIPKTALMTHCTATGECLDGARVTGGAAEFFVR